MAAAKGPSTGISQERSARGALHEKLGPLQNCLLSL